VTFRYPFLAIIAGGPHWADGAFYARPDFPAQTGIHAVKGAQLMLVCVNLIIVHFSVEAGRACCDDSVEP